MPINSNYSQHHFSFSEMPNEITIGIFKCLDKKDLVNCSGVNKKWNQLSRDNTIWQSFCKNFLDTIQEYKKSDRENPNYFDLYINRTKFWHQILNVTPKDLKFLKGHKYSVKFLESISDKLVSIENNCSAMWDSPSTINVWSLKNKIRKKEIQCSSQIRKTQVYKDVLFLWNYHSFYLLDSYNLDIGKLKVFQQKLDEFVIKLDEFVIKNDKSLMLYQREIVKVWDLKNSELLFEHLFTEEIPLLCDFTDNFLLFCTMDIDNCYLEKWDFSTKKCIKKSILPNHASIIKIHEDKLICCCNEDCSTKIIDIYDSESLTRLRFFVLEKSIKKIKTYGDYAVFDLNNELFILNLKNFEFKIIKPQIPADADYDENSLCICHIKLINDRVVTTWADASVQINDLHSGSLLKNFFFKDISHCVNEIKIIANRIFMGLDNGDIAYLELKK